MKYIADLHIHSPYSRATSKESHLAGLAGWGAVKGINIVGSGDFTHPVWFRELREQLEPAEPGLFLLKSGYPASLPVSEMAQTTEPVRFLLSAEVSCIYKRHGRVRKVHNLLYVPDFESAERLNRRLAAIGNIKSDGRPILGLDSRDLLEIMLEEAPEGFLVPAHIWTPWFSIFGSRSGFDSVEECFGDLAAHIFALETGLSSDPAMNRLISGLDSYALISSSDCHSPSKLGREANLFNTGFDFFSLRDALKRNSRESFSGTVEFFPEEGKYHGDGHDSCNVCLTPEESRRADGICPACRKPLTIGVLNRVMELADRDEPLFPSDAPEVFSLIPLQEIIAGIHNCGAGTKKVLQDYAAAIRIFGSELELQLRTPLEVIGRHSSLLAEAVGRMRRGQVIREPGFDGRYGIISLFAPGELGATKVRASLFSG